MTDPALLFRQTQDALLRAQLSGAPETARVLGAIARMIAAEGGLDPLSGEPLARSRPPEAA